MTSNQQKYLRAFAGVALALVGTTLFSIKSIIVKLCYQAGMTTEELMAARYGISFPIFVMMAFFATRRNRISSMDRKMQFFMNCSVLGILGYWLSSYFDFLGLQYVPANVERMVLFTYPLLTILFAWIIFGKRPGRISIGASMLAYSGLGVMFLVGEGNGTSHNWGMFLIFLSAASFALYQLYAKRVVMLGGAALATAIMMSAACIAALAAYLVTNGASPPHLGGDAFCLVLVLAIGGTVLPAVFMGLALERISGEINASIGAIGPVITIILAAAILGEAMPSGTLLGTVLILLGVSIFTFSEIVQKHRKIA